ncbi:MAG TPA: glycine--tRNA ligase subunit beta [Wenzhouxiangella sp.]|nr:glycine--tRNA ligase subunit beta [Wenzhouxiangella sp.]
MTRTADLLVEIGCEELPSAQIGPLLERLAEGLSSRLEKAGLLAGDAQAQLFGTPRRLAVRLPGVAERQQDRTLVRRGPAIAAAFDEHGKPTRAAEGFARSAGLPLDALETVETDKGAWLAARIEQPGQALEQLLPEFFSETVKTMSGSRSMHWADRDDLFLRPVRWLVAVHGDRPVALSHFGLDAGSRTRGHRIHAPGWHAIAHAADYEAVLQKAFVQVDREKRHRLIVEQAEALARAENLQAVLEPALVDEVTGLTEWPVAVLGEFDAEFLDVPEPAIISSLQVHQKCFALRRSDGRLAPYFIAVANAESTNPAEMTAGFERVVRPRLADARFFWDKDRNTALAQRVERLDDILFQKQLGTVGDKVRRVEKLLGSLAPALNAGADTCIRAARLCKCDLVTDMVGEFPELQGVMGRYYALEDGEDSAVAQAIGSHYRPRSGSDALPETAEGMALALADRLDTLLGIFAAGLKPKGSRDPFALRRAALGVVRILAESQAAMTLAEALEAAARTFPDSLGIDAALLEEVEHFIFERLRSFASDHGMEANTVHAVAGGRPGSVADFMARAQALQRFADDPDMESLIAASKRAGNLLKQADQGAGLTLDPSLLEAPAERALADAIKAARNELRPAIKQSDFPTAIGILAGLQKPVDRFFDEVMVMSDDVRTRNNRLALLAELRAQFLHIADVARLGR